MDLPQVEDNIMTFIFYPPPHTQEKNIIITRNGNVCSEIFVEFSAQQFLVFHHFRIITFMREKYVDNHHAVGLIAS